MIRISDPAALFQSVSDATRLRLLRLLDREELNVRDLVRITGLSQPRISKHLAVLREHGWLRQRREGTFSWYRAVATADVPAGTDLYGPILAAADAIAEAPADDRLLDVVRAERRARSRDFFSGLADRWESIRGEFEHEDLKTGAIAALVPSGLRVLDIGTGTGAMLPLFAGTGADVFALDHSPAMLARARARSRESGLENVVYSVGDVGHLPFGDGSFDACNCSMVLHHVADPQQALNEMVRTVRPGGMVMLTAFCRHEQEWMREELAHQWLGFEPAEIEEYFRCAGLGPPRMIIRGGSPDHEVPPAGSAVEIQWPEVFLATGRRERPCSHEPGFRDDDPLNRGE